MATLDKTQHSKILILLKKYSIDDEQLNDELLDHFASIIEEEMAKGVSFEDALKKVDSAETQSDLKKMRTAMVRNLLLSSIMNGIQNRAVFELFLGLVIWVLIEFIFVFLGINELGAVYGAISVFLIFIVQYRNSKRITTHVLKKHTNWFILFKYGIKMPAIVSVLFFIFLILFWTYIYTEFYTSFQFDAGEPKPDNLAVKSALSASVAIFITGILAALFISIGMKKPGFSQSYSIR